MSREYMDKWLTENCDKCRFHVWNHEEKRPHLVCGYMWAINDGWCAAKGAESIRVFRFRDKPCDVKEDA